jgi:hypothetical protein
VSRAFTLTNLASRLGKRGCPQANRVTLTKSCRCNNSSGDGLGHRVRLTGECSLVSFTYPRNCLGSKDSR